MKVYRCRSALAGLLLAGLLPMAVQAEENPLARVESFLSATGTMSASFEQVLLDSNGRVLAESSGTMAIKRPGLFRWHYTDPEELLVLGDGEQVWNYDVELENVTVASQKETLAGNPAALLAGSGNVADSFSAEKTWRGGETDWIELVPREKQRDFRRVRLGFSGDTLVAMELYDQLGQTTRIAFDQILQNAPVDDELFAFSPPEGVDVITAGGLTP